MHGAGHWLLSARAFSIITLAACAAAPSALRISYDLPPFSKFALVGASPRRRRRRAASRAIDASSNAENLTPGIDTYEGRRPAASVLPVTCLLHNINT